MVDHVLESLDSDGKFWCFFPSHGNQNFFSRTWIFHYFFFHDMVPSQKERLKGNQTTTVKCQLTVVADPNVVGPFERNKKCRISWGN